MSKVVLISVASSVGPRLAEPASGEAAEGTARPQSPICKRRSRR